MTTTTPTETKWLYASDYPPAPNPRDLKEFFGIPPTPDTPENLDQNIREKRKLWRKKVNNGSAEGRKHADAVLQAIDEAEDAVKRGASSDGSHAGTYGAGEVDTATPSSVEEAWRKIETLLFRGRHADALERLSQWRPLFGSDPRFLDLSAVTILDVATNAPTIPVPRAVLDGAIADARLALAEFGYRENHVMTLIELLDIAGDTAAADAVFEEAAKRLERPSGEFLIRRLKVMLRQPQWPATLRFAVDLVNRDPDDRSVRSDIVQMFVANVTSSCLPIDSPEKLATYREVIDTTAWIASGVPEAEDFVRAHRMWAANADQPIYAGSWQWRAFFTLITGFLLLPLFNRSFAQPAWKILLRGPAAAQNLKKPRDAVKADRAWFLVSADYVHAAHADVKLPWQSVPGSFPEAQVVFET